MIGKYIDAFADLLLHRRDRAYVEWYLKYSLSLRKFKNIHLGEDCFIVGNGPSLNKIDLNILNNYYTFGLNKIYLLFDRSNFRPTYHVAVNPLVIQQSIKEFENMKCIKFLSYGPCRGIIKYNDSINYIYMGGKISFQENLISELNACGTVTYVAMQIAFYMGFKNVYLVGVDHNFIINGKPNDLQLINGKDINHFSPDYFGGKEWHLPDLKSSELGYSLAKFIYEMNERNIYDSTVDGKLTIYEKIDYEIALSRCRKKSILL